MRYRYLFQLNEYLLIAVWLVVVIGEERCGLCRGKRAANSVSVGAGAEAGAMTLIFLAWRSCQGQGRKRGVRVDRWKPGVVYARVTPKPGICPRIPESSRVCHHAATRPRATPPPDPQLLDSLASMRKQNFRLTLRRQSSASKRRDQTCWQREKQWKILSLAGPV